MAETKDRDGGWVQGHSRRPDGRVSGELPELGDLLLEHIARAAVQATGKGESVEPMIHMIKGNVEQTLKISPDELDRAILEGGKLDIREDVHKAGLMSALGIVEGTWDDLLVASGRVKGREPIASTSQGAIIAKCHEVMSESVGAPSWAEFISGGAQVPKATSPRRG